MNRQTPPHTRPTEIPISVNPSPIVHIGNVIHPPSINVTTPDQPSAIGPIFIEIPDRTSSDVLDFPIDSCPSPSIQRQAPVD
ncbi:hypothetical protein BLNAU_1644 [Blattamonas nauphoetae]|uniref:Uncharacterized protein n=1 Tax=Blattamonas nauphoetae TaxID=2049346 RepID=A0ABQ9YIL8_9EUKA|nr:hypothetical protein BLNAU_1644 [Blattamonas nauphoetae]